MPLGVLSRNAGSSNRELPPVLLVHGATFGSGLFDLPVPGYSLMEELAQNGRPVYALDIRGYGQLRGRLADELRRQAPTRHSRALATP